MSETLTPRKLLEKHSAEFEKEIIRIAEGVYTAVGFDASNCSMIEGDDGIIIIDTLMSTEAAGTVLNEFRKISDKPVKAIVYTHSHEDHIGGAKIFAEDGSPEIICRANFSRDTGENSPLQKALFDRMKRQFGVMLPIDEIINMAVGPGGAPPRRTKPGYLPATRMFSEERINIKICNVDLELVAAPGETDDQLYAWFPEKKVLFCGDNYYKTFPNLYAIRGTKYRDVLMWAGSLEKMILEAPDFLVPGHTRPLRGKTEVNETLEGFRNAILSVFNQTIEAINKGMTPDELVEDVKLPPELADKPYLIEFYGSVPFAARAIFNGLLGWFDGNPTNLFPLTPKDEAQRFVGLAGGEEKVMTEMESSFGNQDWQWVCELADRILRLGGSNVKKASELKTKALRALAENHYNVPARNYYLSCALELEEQSSKR